jgi:Rieske Fe-S protein
LAIVIGGVVGLVPLVTGTLFFLDPLLRKKAKPEPDGDEGYVKLDVTLDQLKQAGVPVQVPIISSKVDKWNRYPDQPIGSVYLQMGEDGKTVSAFNVTCPHLGCAVEYRETPSDKTPEFYCPCHASAFGMDGKKKNVIPPRDLDSLDVKVVKNDQGLDEVWVKYQEFRATLAEKVPV